MGKQIGTLISKSKIYYYSLKSVNPKQLDITVIFNRYGWKHLLYDGSDRRRNNKDIELRLFLLRDAKYIISTTILPVITTTGLNEGSRTIKYLEFYGKSRRINRYVKVIVRQIGEGNYHFYSIRRSKRNKNPA